MYPLINDSKKSIRKQLKWDFKVEEDEEDFDDTLRFAIKPVSSLLLCCNKSKKNRRQDEDDLFDLHTAEEVQKIVYFDNKIPVPKCSQTCYATEAKRPNESKKQSLHCQNTNCAYNKRDSISDYKPESESCAENEDFMHFVPVGSTNITPSTTNLFAKSAGLVPTYSSVSLASNFFSTVNAFDVRMLNYSNPDKKVDFVELSPVRNPSSFSNESDDDQLYSLQSSQKFGAKSSDDRFIQETLQIWNTEVLPKPTSFLAETKSKVSKTDLIKNELSNLQSEFKDARILRKGLAPPRFYIDEVENADPQSSVVRLKDRSDYPLIKHKPLTVITEDEGPIVISDSIKRAIENLQSDPMYSILKSTDINKLDNSSQDKKPTPDSNNPQHPVSPIYKPSYAYNLKRIPSSSIVDSCVYMQRPSVASFMREKTKSRVGSDHPVFQLCEMIEIEEAASRKNLALIEEMKKERDEHLDNIFVTEINARSNN